MDASIFILKGFVCVENSLEFFVSQFRKYNYFRQDKESGYLKLQEKELEKRIKCLINSVFYTVKDREIILSNFDETLFKLSQGILIDRVLSIYEVNDILNCSINFNNKLESQCDFDLSGGFSFEWFGVKPDYISKHELNELARYLHISSSIFFSLSSMILKISEAKHGSTLIFGFNKEINNEELFQKNPIEVKVPYGSTFLKLVKRIKVNEEILKKIKCYEKVIINFSKSDGALIFNSDLDLICAGAFLKAKSSADSDKSMSGARHRFAESFI